MRKIEKAMMEAIRSGKAFHSGNTMVTAGPNPRVYLHGNEIAFTDPEYDGLTANRETFRLWPTRTTVSRLRALGVDAYIRKGIAMIGDKPA